MEPHDYWQHEFEHQQADLAHRLESQVTFSNSALKNLMLVNGGAIISLLTFIGNKGSLSNPSALKWSMICFGAGLFFSLGAYFGAYFSQAFFMVVAGYRMRNAQSQMAGGEVVHDDQPPMDRGNGFLIVGLVCAFLGLLLFGIGTALAMQGILG